MEKQIMLEFIDCIDNHWKYFITFEEVQNYNWNIICKFPNSRKRLIEINLKDEKVMKRYMNTIFNENSKYYEIEWLNMVEIIIRLLKKRSAGTISFVELRDEMKKVEELINSYNRINNEE